MERRVTGTAHERRGVSTHRRVNGAAREQSTWSTWSAVCSRVPRAACIKSFMHKIFRINLSPHISPLIRHRTPRAQSPTVRTLSSDTTCADIPNRSYGKVYPLSGDVSCNDGNCHKHAGNIIFLHGFKLNFQPIIAL